MSDDGAVWLARHGETGDNAAGRIQGRADPPLNDRGREQARALAERVRGLGLVALYASALRRAGETAAIVGAAVGLEPRRDERFDEVDWGDWQGLLVTDIARDFPDEWEAYVRGGAEFRFPGGESLGEHAERVEAALRDVREQSLPALVVCHGGSIRAAIALRERGDLSRLRTIHVSNGELFRI